MLARMCGHKELQPRWFTNHSPRVGNGFQMGNRRNTEADFSWLIKSGRQCDACAPCRPYSAQWHNSESGGLLEGRQSAHRY